jgi:hypothetical protein
LDEKNHNNLEMGIPATYVFIFWRLNIDGSSGVSTRNKKCSLLGEAPLLS